VQGFEVTSVKFAAQEINFICGMHTVINHVVIQHDVFEGPQVRLQSWFRLKIVGG
jgi:hypothetical protein